MNHQPDFGFQTIHWRHLIESAWLSFRIPARAATAIAQVINFPACITEIVWHGMESMSKGLVLRRVILPQAVERKCHALIIRQGIEKSFAESHMRSNDPTTFTGCCHG